MLKNNIKYVAGMLLATVFLSACGEEQSFTGSSDIWRLFTGLGYYMA